MPRSQDQDHPGILRTKGKENSYLSGRIMILLKCLNHILLIGKEANKLDRCFFNMNDTKFIIKLIIVKVNRI